LFGYPDGQGVRPLCQPLAEELACSKSRIGASRTPSGMILPKA
jgi:hypothetical protein